MRVVRESLGEEYLVASTHHASVVQVNIVHKEPRAHTVVGQCAPLLRQLHHIFVEQQSRLVLRVGSQVMSRAVPQMAETALGRGRHLIEPAGRQTGVHVRHEIDPQGQFRAVERSLLDEALSAVATIGSSNVVALIGGVAQEIAFEHGNGTLQVLVYELVISVEHGPHLLFEGQGGVGHPHDGMILMGGAHLEAEDACLGMVERNACGHRPFLNLHAKVLLFWELKELKELKGVKGR